jgi:hypothetical protein
MMNLEFSKLKLLDAINEIALKLANTQNEAQIKILTDALSDLNNALYFITKSEKKLNEIK